MASNGAELVEGHSATSTAPELAEGNSAMSLPGKNVTVRRHLPHLPALSKTTKIIVLGTLTAIFVVLEIVIGYASNSLALVADAFHAASDFLSLAIAFYAVRLAQRKMPEVPSGAPAEDDPKGWKSREDLLVRHKLYAQLTFGLQRAEVLGALVNATFLLSLCFSIFVQAIERFFSIAREGSGELTQPKLVLIVGAVGLCINIVGMLMFAQDGHHGHDHGTHSHESSGHQHGHGSHRDLNAYGVFLHVFGDALGSVAVIISATIVWLCQGDWRFYMDPAVSVLFTVIVAVTTVPLVMRTARIMLLASPSSISITDLKRRILELDGVIDLHEVHVFELKSGLLVASLHVVLEVADGPRASGALRRRKTAADVVWCEKEDCANDGCGQCSPFETPRNYDSIAASIRLVMHQFGVHATTIQPEFVRAVPKDGGKLAFVPLASDADLRKPDVPSNSSSVEFVGRSQSSRRLHHHHPLRETEAIAESNGLGVLAGLPIAVEEGIGTEDDGLVDAVAELTCTMQCPASESASNLPPLAPSRHAHSDLARSQTPEQTVEGDCECCETTVPCGPESQCCPGGVSERGRLRKLDEAEKALAQLKALGRQQPSRGFSWPRIGRGKDDAGISAQAHDLDPIP